MGFIERMNVIAFIQLLGTTKNHEINISNNSCDSFN